MLKTLRTIGMLACLLSLTTMGRTQNAGTLPTATGYTTLQAGGGFSYARPDYGNSAIMGASLFADYNFSMHLGVEADIHRISFVTPTNLAENSYFIGPRFLFPHGRFTFYCKGLVGEGDLVATDQQNSPGIQNNGNTLSFAYSLGGGIDYQATPRIVVRALDYERQRWSYIHGLTPAVYTVGVAYRFR